ncbi:MFS transporter [Chitinophaga horti]|uniref:MFS transporter n=1 Tax=Chitinophaga horti TaxID=2920382 RepID=A0ABY6J3W2_9BACT|nr:MFS transporter [Chitinophaga horti]UYQ94356.1 MFS transporter [Chitinophaga horti]
MENTKEIKQRVFTPYQVFVITILAFLQFTVVLDFMVMSPLGTLLMDKRYMGLTPHQFTTVVSAYAISAGISGFLSASFADKFDRKKLLLFFYSGFVLGTLFCGLAPTYATILAARIFTGVFGGVLASISFAIITDLFPLQVRGRVMGFVQMAFSVSQIMGIPVGIKLASMFNWHAPFLLIVGICIPVGIIIAIKLKPVNAHLQLQQATRDRNPMAHLFSVIKQPAYLRAFTATMLMATGGFMLMPLGSDFTVHNVGIPFEDQFLIYMAVGCCTLIAGPLLGKLADKVGKFKVFVGGSILAMIMVGVYTHLSITPIWVVIIINALMMIGVSSRMISGSALMTAVPEMKDRGAFMAVNSSVQQVSGGIAALIAGMIVIRQPDGHLERFDIMGYVIIASMIAMIPLLYVVYKYVMSKSTAAEKKAA